MFLINVSKIKFYWKNWRYVGGFNHIEEIIKLRSINHREEIHHASFYLVEITR